MKNVKRLLAFLLVFVSVISVFSVVTSALSDFDDDYGAFLDKMGYYESRNNYNVKNEYGYMGRWQMGHMALQDIGFMINSTTYSSMAAKFGVYSDEDFLNSPAAQDYCIQLFDKKLYGYIKYYGDEKYVGQTMWDIKITLSGLVAAAHLVGAGGLHNMLKSGNIACDAAGNQATFYLRELAGYDILKSITSSAKESDTSSSNGLLKIDGSWKYYKNGKVDTSYTGMAKNQYGWFYVTKGKLDTTYTGMAKNEYGWWYMTNGKLDTSYTGLAKNQYGWWYMKNGKIDYNFKGLAKNEYGWWYVQNGTINFKYNGTATNQYGKWKVVNGKVTTKA